jgi:hypothetical protein
LEEAALSIGEFEIELLLREVAVGTRLAGLL